jgi:hypothetical protein
MPIAWGNRIAGTGRWLRKEFDAGRPVFLFFLVGFLLLLLLVKLTVAQFSVEVRALSTAAVAALLAAKAVLILDETPLARSLERYRRIVAIAVKTLFYGIVTTLLGYAERILEARHRLHGFVAAFHYVIDHASRDRILAWSLGASMVFGLYFSFVEIGKRMGEWALWKLFFERPDARRDTRIAAKR